MSEATVKRGYLATVFENRCPRCRQGKLFKNTISIGINKNMEMHEYCPVCSQRTELEVGFYYGTGFVSYGLAVLISVITFLVWWLAIGFSYGDNRFMWWVIVNAVLLIGLQPWLMRFSRSLWISWFVSYDPAWQTNKPDNPERIVEEHMRNW